MEKRTSDELEFDVVLVLSEDGGFVVSVPDLPVVTIEGDTKEEARAILKDAIQGYLEAMKEHWYPVIAAQHEHVIVNAS